MTTWRPSKNRGFYMGPIDNSQTTNDLLWAMACRGEEIVVNNRIEKERQEEQARLLRPQAVTPLKTRVAKGGSSRPRGEHRSSVPKVPSDRVVRRQWGNNTEMAKMKATLDAVTAEREKRERKVMDLSGTLSAMQTSILKQSSRAQQQQHLQHSQRQNQASSIIPDGRAAVPKLRL